MQPKRPSLEETILAHLGTEPASLDAAYALREQLVALLDGWIEETFPPEQAPDKIAANSTAIEVRDAVSHRLVRRELPMEYYENDNAIRLRGETMDGAPSEIVFISGTAVEKMRDLTGHGRNQPRCDHGD